MHDLLAKLKRWRQKASANTRQWRQDVQDELRDMGHEIDFADLELHQQEAQEQAMLNQARQWGRSSTCRIPSAICDAS